MRVTWLFIGAICSAAAVGGCGLSHTGVEGRRDPAPADAAPADASPADPGPADCPPLACGDGCTARIGAGRCAECECEPHVGDCPPIACPFECREACSPDGLASCDCAGGDYAVLRMQRICVSPSEPAWEITLIPESERDPLLTGALAEPSASIRILMATDMDFWHEPTIFVVGDESLVVARCAGDGARCSAPGDGSVEVETGGAGEARLVIDLFFDSGDVFVETGWFGYDVGASPDC